MTRNYGTFQDHLFSAVIPSLYKLEACQKWSIFSGFSRRLKRRKIVNSEFSHFYWFFQLLVNPLAVPISLIALIPWIYYQFRDTLQDLRIYVVSGWDRWTPLYITFRGHLFRLLIQSGYALECVFWTHLFLTSFRSRLFPILCRI